MKKNMYRFLCLALVLSMLLLLGGCASGKKKLLGSWQSTLDLTQLMNEQLQSDVEMGEYFSVESFVVKMNLTLREDDTYTMSVDRASMEAAMVSMLDGLEKGMVAYMQDLLDQAGLSNYSVEDMLASMNMSMDELMADSLQYVTDNDELYEGLNSEGRYKVKSGKLYMSDSIDTEVDETVYELYTLSRDTLTLTENVDPSADAQESALAQSLYPMIFTRMGE